MTETAFDISPSAVDIGDGLKTAKGRPGAVVTDVDADKRRVKVYTPTGEQTVHQWVGMGRFSIHNPNKDVQTDADRERWLNETLPQAYTCRDGERRKMEYVLDEDGHVQRVVQD